MTLQIAGLAPVPGQPGLFYGPRNSCGTTKGCGAGAFFAPLRDLPERRDAVLEAVCPPEARGLFAGLAGLLGLEAEPTPRVRDFVNVVDFSWYAMSAADKKKFGTPERWWQAFGKDNRVSSRASFAAIQAEKPNATPKEAQQWWSSIGKNSRQRLRAKYTKGYGDNVFDDIANVAKKGVSVIPVYGQAVAAGINVAQGQGAFKDPLKAATYLIAGQNAGQIAPFVSSKGLQLNKKAFKQAVQANIDMIKGASGGVGVKDTQLPQNLPKMPDVAKLAKQGSAFARQLPNTAAISDAMRKVSSNTTRVSGGKPAPTQQRPVLTRRPTTKPVAKKTASNKELVALQKQLNALLAKERKEDKTQATQLRKLREELNKTKQAAAVQDAVQKAVQEALARQAAMQSPQYAQPSMYQPFPGYAPQFAPQALPMVPQQPTVYASQALPQLSPEDYAAMQLPTSLNALHGVLV